MIQMFIYKPGIAGYKTGSSSQNQEHVQSNIFMDELIVFTVKKHNDYIKFDQVKQSILQQMDQYADKIVEWLSKDQSESRYVWFRGLLYHYGIVVDKDSNRGF